MGWHCIIIWECELKTQNRSKTLESLAFTLNKIYLQDHTRQYIINEQNDREMVAEDLQK